MKKPTRTKFFILAFICMGIIMILWGFLWDVKFPGDVIEVNSIGTHHYFGAVHVLSNIVFILLWIATVIFLLYEVTEEEDDLEIFYRDDNSEDDEVKPIKIKKYIYWLIGLSFLIVLYGFGKNVFIDSVKIFNKSKLYHNEYTKKIQEKQGFYDKLWKTYLQKEKITNINKETFLLVTKMIMENRKDGEKLTWKWLQENQPIPYDEYTKFYADLSDFIAKQRDGYFKIEQQCQEIANRNNTLLDTFPNNIYNKVIKCDRINFEYGFLSDSTISVFNSKKENL